MLKTRIIPTLLWKNESLVKGERFDSWRTFGPLMPAIKLFNMRDVDELILLDITATSKDVEPDYSAIEELATECFVPFTIGGGIKSIEMIRNLLLVGADKVAINSAAYNDPFLVQEASNRFGAQCIVVSIDVHKKSNGEYTCFSHSGTADTGWDPLDWAKKMESLGAGEILLNSIEHDGTMQGYNLETIELISNAVNIPVIASGGAGNAEHMLTVLQETKASAVAAASIFLFTDSTPAEMRNYLAEHKIPVRYSTLT
jgi:cyclase